MATNQPGVSLEEIVINDQNKTITLEDTINLDETIVLDDSTLMEEVINLDSTEASLESTDSKQGRKEDNTKIPDNLGVFKLSS